MTRRSMVLALALEVITAPAWGQSREQSANGWFRVTWRPHADGVVPSSRDRSTTPPLCASPTCGYGSRGSRATGMRSARELSWRSAISRPAPRRRSASRRCRWLSAIGSASSRTTPSQAVKRPRPTAASSGRCHIFDRSELPIDENVKETRRALEAIKSINPSILVEGELGYIGTSSEVLSEIPAGVGALTSPEEARQFVTATGVDVLAPAVGNMHGLLESMVHGQAQKRLDIARIAELKAATGIFMTLHGGSGTNDEDFQKAIRAGINIIHINTELRVAWRRGLETALATQPHAVAPYKILPGALEAVSDVVRARLRLFSEAR